MRIGGGERSKETAPSTCMKSAGVRIDLLWTRPLRMELRFRRASSVRGHQACAHKYLGPFHNGLFASTSFGTRVPHTPDEERTFRERVRSVSSRAGLEAERLSNRRRGRLWRVPRRRRREPSRPRRRRRPVLPVGRSARDGTIGDDFAYSRMISAISVAGANFERGAVLLANGRSLETTFGNPRWLTRSSLGTSTGLPASVTLQVRNARRENLEQHRFRGPGARAERRESRNQQVVLRRMRPFDPSESGGTSPARADPSPRRFGLLRVGTRPEAIKLAPVVRAATEQGRFRPVSRTSSTERCSVRPSAVRPRPNIDLDVMTAGQTPTRIAFEVMRRLEPYLAEWRPAWTVVQGDTTSAFAGRGRPRSMREYRSLMWRRA